jgi:hypothetical protein
LKIKIKAQQRYVTLEMQLNRFAAAEIYFAQPRF